MESSSVASASSEAGSTRSQEIEELERFIDSYVLEYQVQGLLNDKNDTDQDVDKPPTHASQWAEDCSDKVDGSWSSSRGRGSSKPDEWEHSSNGSTGSRPSSGSQHGSGSRSGSRGQNNQFRAKNGNRDCALDILGTDIWAANLDSHGGATWDMQPEKLDFSQFHRRPYRGTPKHLPHIDREGMMKGTFEDDDDDGIDLESINKFLPTLPVFPPLQNDADIAHAKKLFRRRRTDRRRTEPSPDQLTVQLSAEGKRQVSRRQQRPPGGGGGGGVKSQNPLQQHGLQQQQPPNQTQQQANADHQSGVSTKHGGWGYQGQQNQGGRQGGPHHGYSQNRRWHQHPKHQTNNFSQGGDRTPTRIAKETENVKQDEPEPRIERAVKDEPVREQRPKNENEGKTEAGKISLLQSSKERLRKRLKEKEDVPVATAGPQQNRMDRLLEILNSMRNNRSGVEAQLTAFMEEAQSSADSEETLNEIVHTIYHKAVSDRSFAATAAKLCDKMALFMVEGTKFRSLLLNMLQRDFTRRDELRQMDVESWLGFVTFLCEVFGTMRSSAGEPFRVLVCPIYSCLRELLQSPDVKEDAVLCCSMELQSTGRLLEDQLPEMMTELLAAVRDKMLCPSESQLTRSLLMEVVELHAHRWSPLEALTTAYYNRTIQKLTA
ncbi:CBP80/20-dependent translation initiation factor isoform X2 [Triplophysa dalaica]|uniref:CBP80/20-dependent translation initiation factor isoform X2 n=1 Tax=Triplophysa dalaica TaxID=1582913 RepID=UPI0024E040AF|nr:CBP80/20-dependent translation initiation factor isoform X2 [Triplophysa dalaica]